MGVQDKFENKAEELKGRAKESAGAATDDQDLKNEGRLDQAKSALHKGAEKLKDKANEVAEKVVGDDNK
ncbi:MAG: CsbD family protein [Gordonia sp. (in: high G+C Gram-positive bacteria)]|uniref:CsbD family protein n=1 Tax=Gordonia sp. (in: high G+C Gram-positive bacteria) TaxID=84139 RepID=UPI003BB494CE